MLKNVSVWFIYSPQHNKYMDINYNKYPVFNGLLFAGLLSLYGYAIKLEEWTIVQTLFSIALAHYLLTIYYAKE